MVKKCQCQRRIRTNTDGTCVNSDNMCKSCISAEQAKVDEKKVVDEAPEDFKSVTLPKVVDQTVESDLSVDSKVEVKPIGAHKGPPAEVKPIGAYKGPPAKVVPLTSDKSVNPYGAYRSTTSDIDEKGPKKS